MSVILMVLFLISGVLVGQFLRIPDSLHSFIKVMPFYCLCFMLVVVGYGMGRTKDTFKNLTRKDLSLVLVPLGTIVGTLAGGTVASFFIPETIKESLAVAAGFGWYSFSGIYLAETYSTDLGAVAFFSNIFRETLAILIIPATVKYFCPESAVSAAGATSMDVTMPIITKYSNEKYAILAFLHGSIISFIIPLLLPFIVML